MSAAMIQLVARAIAKRLTAALTAAAVPSPTVHIGPVDDASAGSATLILFLHRATPSMAMRNEQHIVFDPVHPAKPQVYDRSLPLDLGFLLTGGPGDKGGSDEPLGVLGLALQALNDAPLLTGGDVAGETVRISIESASAEEISRAWALFPAVNYRTSVMLLVSPVWIDPALPEIAAAPVALPELVFGQL